MPNSREVVMLAEGRNARQTLGNEPGAKRVFIYRIISDSRPVAD